MMGRSSSTTTSKGKWLGPCGKDMKPGDTIMSNGQKINILDMMNKVPKMDLGQLGGNGQAPSPEQMQKLMEQAQKLQQQMQQAN